MPILTPEETEDALDLALHSKRQVQRYLAALGYPAGSDDGVFGPQTRKALAAFQKDSGILDTGYVDRASVERLEEVYESAPMSHDGTWRLSLLRSAARSNRNFEDNAGLLNMMGFVEFQIIGRNVELLNSANLSNAPVPKDPDMRGTLTRNGRLEISVVMNYVHFRNDYRRVLATLQLPERVLVGQEFDVPGGSLSSDFRFQGRLRRLSATR